MNKIIFGIGGFLLGGVAGILACRRYWENIANEDIEAVKRYWEDKYADGKEKCECHHEKKVSDEEVEEMAEEIVNRTLTAVYKTETQHVNYSDLSRKPDLDDIPVEEYDRWEYLNDADHVPEDCSIVELTYDAHLNVFEDEDGVVDARDLIGEDAMAKIVMGEGNGTLSVLDTEMNVLYEVETDLGEIEENFDIPTEAPMSLKELRAKAAEMAEGNLKD